MYNDKSKQKNLNKQQAFNKKRNNKKKTNSKIFTSTYDKINLTTIYRELCRFVCLFITTMFRSKARKMPIQLLFSNDIICFQLYLLILKNIYTHIDFD